jgi:hypothetical protein
MYGEDEPFSLRQTIPGDHTSHTRNSDARFSRGEEANAVIKTSMHLYVRRAS